jgi:hypothetical protein
MTTLSAENSRATREFQGLLASFRLRERVKKLDVKKLGVR